jgi:hypothetical protein
MFALARSAACRIALTVLASSGAASAQRASLEDHGFLRSAPIAAAVSGHRARPSYVECHAPVWVPGRYETRCERVWVEGRSRQVWAPARYEWRWDGCGRMYRVCVSAGRWTTVVDPGHYESRDVRVWVPGHWRTA